MTKNSGDFTVSAAKQWVAQEAAKCRTPDAAQARIKSENEFIAMITAPGRAIEYPNSLQAHKDLIEVLQNKFA